MNVSAEQTKRLRGLVLELLEENHQAQGARYDLLTLWAVITRLGHDLGRDQLITILQDMEDREYVRFDCEKNKDTNRLRISKIEITPRGRDLLEGTIHDKAVELK